MITASIVLFHTKEADLETVVSSYAPTEERRLFIIDNSEKCTLYAEALANDWITYQHNQKNLGYGAAHNIGIQKSIEMKADYHIVLNPDLQFDPSVIDKLQKYADQHDDVVYLMPKVVYPDGRLQYLCKLLPTPYDLIFRRFFPKVGPLRTLNDRYVLKQTGYQRIMNPPCLSGCFMFMRAKTLKEYQLFFDERFFMYCEDFDLMRRLHRVGKTIFYPYVQIVHNHERSSYKNAGMLLQHIKSACRYFNKYGWIIDKERQCENRKILKEIADE